MANPQTPARALAVLRILLGVVVLGAADVWRAPLLIEPVWLAEALRALVLVAACLTIVGWQTRASGAVLTLSVGVLFGLLQRQGTPIHVHHVVWLSALLVAAPAGAAWSIDARGHVPDERTQASAELALRFACVLLALVYFFPGLHKVVDAGSPFFDGASLVRLVRLKGLEAGASVAFSLDQHPTLIHVGGVVVAAAELAVLVAAMFRPRVGFALVVLIHVAITVALRMPYTVLAVFAVVFLLPTSRHSAALRERAVVSLVGALLTVGIVQAGVRGDMRGYPFACYPTFATPVPERIAVLSIDLLGAQPSALPHDVVVPDELRTPVTFAARRVTTAAQAEQFVRWRMRDARFAAAVGNADRVRVTVVWRDLNAARADAPIVTADVAIE